MSTSKHPPWIAEGLAVREELLELAPQLVRRTRDCQSLLPRNLRKWPGEGGRGEERGLLQRRELAGLPLLDCLPSAVGGAGAEAAARVH